MSRFILLLIVISLSSFSTEFLYAGSSKDIGDTPSHGEEQAHGNGGHTPHPPHDHHDHDWSQHLRRHDEKLKKKKI